MSDVRLILGKRNSGKSWALREWIRGEPRAVLYDTVHEPTYDEFTRVETIPDLCAALARNEPNFRIAYAWNGELPREDDFELVCRAIYCCRNLTFAVDEIDLHSSPASIPRHLDMIVSLGRHRGISFWAATRRPKEVHPLIRSQANRVVSFCQTEPADLEWCQQVIGDMTEKLPTLPLHQSVTWTDVQTLDTAPATGVKVKSPNP